LHGSNLTRLARVVRDLTTHPQHIYPYFSIGPWSAKTPLELGLPWFSLSAIRFLDKYVSKTMDVFEYGSGGSTIYFANHAASVTSTEDNQQWLQRVEAALAAEGITNATLQFRPFDFHAAVDFKKSDYLHSIPDRPFDIIIVDGTIVGETEESVQVRLTCFRHAESRIAPGGIIIVDDSWLYPQLRSAHRAKSYRQFRSIGPCRPGVTSTDILFY
jgi:predicted O-methyltransferase YrrM